MDSKSLIIGLLVGVTLCLVVFVAIDTPKAYAQVTAAPRYQLCATQRSSVFAAFLLDAETGQVFGLTSPKKANAFFQAQQANNVTVINTWVPLTPGP